jgi:hypothetical protein
MSAQNQRSAAFDKSAGFEEGRIQHVRLFQGVLAGLNIVTPAKSVTGALSIA